MLSYRSDLKQKARDLRKAMTDSELLLWSRLRYKQLLGVQFYRQKPIGQYIVDFYASKARLVVEVDGSQHMKGNNEERDKHRDEYMNRLGLKVLRFNSREVLEETDAVLEVICRTMGERIGGEIPPFLKGRLG